MGRLEEAIEKKLVEAFGRELEARGITNKGIELSPEDVEMSGLGGIYGSFKRMFEGLQKKRAQKKPLKVTKRELVQAARPAFKVRAREIAAKMRFLTRQSAKAFKAGKLKPVTMPALPVARTIALRQEEMPCVRSTVREEHVPDVADWGY